MLPNRNSIDQYKRAAQDLIIGTKVSPKQVAELAGEDDKYEPYQKRGGALAQDDRRTR